MSRISHSGLGDIVRGVVCESLKEDIEAKSVWQAVRDYAPVYSSIDWNDEWVRINKIGYDDVQLWSVTVSPFGDPTDGFLVHVYEDGTCEIDDVGPRRADDEYYGVKDTSDTTY